MNKLARNTLILAIIVTIIAIITTLITLILFNSDISLSNSLSFVAVIVTIISLITAAFSIFLVSNNYTAIQKLFTVLHKRRFFLFISTTILVITMLSTYLVIIYNQQTTSAANTCSSANSPHPFSIGAVQAPNGDCIGVSDGSFAFDTHRLDGNLKSQAANKLRTGDMNGAISLLYQAVEKDPNDAEALIYLENQRVLRSGGPYITFVVGTTLAGSTVGDGRDMLQGAYIAQKEYNSSCRLANCLQVRLLIANTGGVANYATSVAQQITQIAQQDKTLVGVMGWSSGLSSLYAIHELETAHIPMVSPMASADSLTNKSPYFFRVVPPDNIQGMLGAKYAENVLHVNRVAVFVDPSNPYSKSLAENFIQQFTSDGKIIVTETYRRGDSESLHRSLDNALNHQPDLIYFAGYADETNTLIDDLPTSGPLAHLIVLGGDALYQVGGYTGLANINRLYFTAFAYPDEWAFQGLTVPPPFFTMYARAFDPNGTYTGNPYGYTRPTSGAMLSYDAMQALLKSTEIALSKKGQDFTSFTPDDLKQALDTVKFQGVTGQITFGADGNPVNKAIAVLYVSSGGFIQIKSIEGQFLAR